MKSDFEGFLFIAAVLFLAMVSMPNGKSDDQRPIETAAAGQH